MTAKVQRQSVLNDRSRRSSGAWQGGGACVQFYRYSHVILLPLSVSLITQSRSVISAKVLFSLFFVLLSGAFQGQRSVHGSAPMPAMRVNPYSRWPNLDFFSVIIWPVLLLVTVKGASVV